MASDKETGQPVTLINVFEVPTEEVDGFVEGWNRIAEVLRHKDGFRDTVLHEAVSGEARFQFINIAHWDSAEAFRTAMADAGFQQASAGRAGKVAANPALYRVAVSITEF
jgi:heme oxygenase (mycobilin-producing)